MFSIKTYYNKGDIFIFLPMTQLLLLRRQLYAWFKCLLLSNLWTLWILSARCQCGVSALLNCHDSSSHSVSGFHGLRFWFPDTWLMRRALWILKPNRRTRLRHPGRQSHPAGANHWMMQNRRIKMQHPITPNWWQILLQHRVKQNRLPLPRRSIRIFQKIPTRKRSIRKYWLWEKNEQLEQTVSWMHDLIWELTRRLHITQSR